MLCTNGHNVPDNVAFCTTCGTSTFRPAPMQYRSYVAAPAKSTNGLAVASMILGIVWIFWLGSLLALIFGLLANKSRNVDRVAREWPSLGSFLASSG